MDFPKFYGFCVFLRILCIHIDFDKFLKIWLAAGCWLDGEEEGFKDVSHARRSGEVGGFLKIWLAGCWLDGEEEAFKDFSHARRSGKVGGFLETS